MQQSLIVFQASSIICFDGHWQYYQLYLTFICWSLLFYFLPMDSFLSTQSNYELFFWQMTDVCLVQVLQACIPGAILVKWCQVFRKFFRIKQPRGFRLLSFWMVAFFSIKNPIIQQIQGSCDINERTGFCVGKDMCYDQIYKYFLFSCSTAIDVWCIIVSQLECNKYFLFCMPAGCTYHSHSCAAKELQCKRFTLLW